VWAIGPDELAGNRLAHGGVTDAAGHRASAPLDVRAVVETSPHASNSIGMLLLPARA
jgi:hypothetical protein